MVHPAIKMILVSEVDDIPESAIRGTLEGPSGLPHEYIDLVDDASSDTTDSSRVKTPDLCPEEAQPGSRSPSPQQQRETRALSDTSPALITKRPKRKRSLSTDPRSSDPPPDPSVTPTEATGQSTSTQSPSPEPRSHGRSSSAPAKRTRASVIASKTRKASASAIARASPNEHDADAQKSRRKKPVARTSARQHKNEGYGGEHKRRKRTLEERKAALADDPYVEDFGPTFVVCKMCGGRLKLEDKGQRSYYLFNWTKHRDSHIRKGETL